MACGWSAGAGCDGSRLLLRLRSPSRTSAVELGGGSPALGWCAGSGSDVITAVCASMCLAGSSDILSVTAPTCTCAGETSTVAGERAGVAAAPLGFTVAAAAGVAKGDATGDGLATGLASTAGDDDGVPTVGAATHPATTTRLAMGAVDQ